MTFEEVHYEILENSTFMFIISDIWYNKFKIIYVQQWKETNKELKLTYGFENNNIKSMAQGKNTAVTPDFTGFPTKKAGANGGPES